MGKYTSWRHKLPAFETSTLEPGLAAWYGKVNEWKKKFLNTPCLENAGGKGPTTTGVASMYADRDAKKKQLEAEISQLNIELEALSSIGVDLLEDAGLQKIDLATGGYVTISDKPYTGTEDREKVMAWIKKNKLTSLLTMNYQTLSGMNNDRLIAGKPLIPGTKITIKTKLVVRGVNGNNGDE